MKNESKFLCKKALTTVVNFEENDTYTVLPGTWWEVDVSWVYAPNQPICLKKCNEKRWLQISEYSLNNYFSKVREKYYQEFIKAKEEL